MRIIGHTAGMATSEDRTILHMAPRADWEAAVGAGNNGNYVDPSLETEGFIHCSTRAQVLIPAHERFHGRTDLVLLVIDLDHVAESTVFEDCYESGQQFPHIYGPVPVAAVTRVIPFPCLADGTFELPAELA